MLKLILGVSLVLSFSSLSFADGHSKRKVAQTTTATDLGKDVMKPMGTAFKTLVTNLTDPTKNTSATATAINSILDGIDKALTITPDTDAYKAESARLVAAATANNGTLAAKDADRLTQLEYTTFLQTVRTLVVQLKTAVTTANANACGQTCTDLVAQIKDLQTLAHLTFQDPEAP